MPTDSQLVIIIGVAIALIGLAILISICVMMSRMSQKKDEAARDSAPLLALPQPAAPQAAAQDDGEIAAVIAAVIAALGTSQQTAIPAEPVTGFRVQRMAKPRTWGRSGREELLSSKIF